MYTFAFSMAQRIIIFTFKIKVKMQRYKCNVEDQSCSFFLGKILRLVSSKNSAYQARYRCRLDSNMPPFWGELLCNQDAPDILRKPDQKITQRDKVIILSGS
jgi:hypothetical protein